MEDEPETRLDVDEKKHKKRSAAQYVDDQCGETRKKKAKKPSKTKPATRKKMQNAKIEFAKLLKELHDPEDPQKIEKGHFDFRFDDLLTLVAEAIHWMWTPEAEDEAHGELIGRDKFWDWWSSPMDEYKNQIWIKKLSKRLDEEIKTLVDHKDAVKELIQKQKDSWHEIFSKARPIESSYYKFRKFVERTLAERDQVLNPDCMDRTLSELALRYLSQKFIILDKNGTSIAWEAEQKLWIEREKERSAVALGESLFQLIKDKIIFTDPEAEEKFCKKVRTTGSTMGILGWLKGKVPVFPNPIKEKLDRETWHVPIKGGKLIDLTTLKVRDRTSADLFTKCMNFSWNLDVPSEDGYIMDSKLLAEFKQEASTCDYLNANLTRLLRKLCPNAYIFLRGPFSNPDRFIFMLLHFGLLLTTYCTRKGIWIYGDGKAMKSTVMTAILKVMGPFAVLLAKKVFFVSGAESGHNTDLMRAEGKRLVVIDELDKKDMLRESLYKQYTARGTISAREIFGGQGEWQPMGTSVFLTNTVVSFVFTDSSIPDRILAVRGLTKVFNPDELRPPMWTTDDEWKDQTDEKTGIHWVRKDAEREQWAVKFQTDEDNGGHMNELGCLLALCAHVAYKIIQKTPTGEIYTPQTVQDDFKRFMEESDHVAQYIAENCIRQNRTELKDLWKDYREWCTDQGIKPVEQKILRSSLNQKRLLFQDKKEYFNKNTGARTKSGAPIWYVAVHLKSSFQIDESMLDAFQAVVDVFHEAGKETEKKEFFNEQHFF